MKVYHSQSELNTAWRMRKLLRPGIVYFLILSAWIIGSPEPFLADQLSQWIFPIIATTVYILLISLSMPRNIEAIELDTYKRKLILDTVHPLWGKKRFEPDFKKLGIKLIDFKGNWLLDQELRIRFYLNKRSWLQLSDRKDDFARKELKELVQELEEMTKAE